MRIAKMISPIIFQREEAETQRAIFVVGVCSHERRSVRLPPVVRTKRDLYDNNCYEYCQDCGETTRAWNH